MSKILVIEDERDISAVLRKRFIDYHYDVVCAYDGYQGVKMAHEQMPDLIILDLMMPAGGGLSVLQNIRMAAATATIPVVVLTGMQDEEYKKKLEALGIDGYFEKPYNGEELVGVVSTIIQKRKKS